MDVAVDLTEAELSVIHGHPSSKALCAYFPVGEFFLQRKETVEAADLPIAVANIKVRSEPASKLAHMQRLKANLPDPVTFGDEYT